MGGTTTTTSTISPETKEALSTNTAIREVDGKIYYYGDDNQPKKDYAYLLDGKVYYFGKDGSLVDTTSPAYQEGLTSLNNAHNEAYDTSKGLTNVDGYLVADTWYRPKEILRGGTTWEASTPLDERPLLMTWWPDKQTQADYVNYMTEKGLGSSDTKAKIYSSKDSQASLNEASNVIQANIESRITALNDTAWLRDTMNAFILTQPKWSKASESDTTGGNKDHLQGGALTYGNNPLTPNANSNYRLMNRTPTNQTGERKYFTDNSLSGYELLLANDVDNSNSVVQAEQLNWLHYLMNFGSIVKNDHEANFDSIRVDAVDNVDADLLQIAADYFKSVYKINENDANSNAHLSILEDWSDNDPYYISDHGANQLSMDNRLRQTFLDALTKPEGNRVELENLMYSSLVNREGDGQKANILPSYTFVRAHDSEVQNVIAGIIHDKIDPTTDGFTFTLDQLKEAFKIYNADQKQTDKQYTHYNIPAAYAVMLTNKNSVPRIYYGDMYTDDGQFMDTKTAYYDAIETMLKGRVKYVAGGQHMAVTYVNGDASMGDSYKGILTSVRYGKGADTASDTGTAETRTEGIAVLVSNNPNLKLSDTDKVVVNMGAAHANQAYRPLIMATDSGIATYASDRDVPANLIRFTDADGNLIFGVNEIYGVRNPQVSGYVAAWVPVGASEGQDARTASSTALITDGKAIHASDALDSQVIFEAFSNFQDFPRMHDEYENVRIAKNAELFKSWGVTYMELPPQYVSSTDGTFLDSIIENGYAFTDRYDLGLSKANKYGTADDLAAALKAIHASGMKAIADWVPDQLYSLSGQEVVSATRTNNYGDYRKGSTIKDLLYVANTKGGGDYQYKYGGAFLDQLKADYPELFDTKQISTGEPIDPSVKIKEWSAKYFNGTNILGRGVYYVLKDWATGEYFKISSDNADANFLPKQLIGEPASTGFVKKGDYVTFYSTSGYQAKGQFIQDGSNWYYFDENGHMVYGLQEITGAKYYFLPNGVMLTSAYLQDQSGHVYYFGRNGQENPNGPSNDGSDDIPYTIDYHNNNPYTPYVPNKPEKPGVPNRLPETGSTPSNLLSLFGLVTMLTSLPFARGYRSKHKRS